VYGCMCLAVCDREIRSCILRGARTVEEVGDSSGAGTGCGSCHDHIDTLLTSMLASSALDELPVTA